MTLMFWMEEILLRLEKKVSIFLEVKKLDFQLPEQFMQTETLSLWMIHFLL